MHVDIKRLGRIRGAGDRVTGNRASQKRTRHEGRLRGLAGWEYVHVIIDDHSRLTYAEVLDDLSATCAITFLRRALTWFAERGVRIEAVMTDNGSCYIAHAYAAAPHQLGLHHLRIRPGQPRTNGKAERFIQTLLNEWAYAHIYGNSHKRTQALPHYLRRNNFKRPHGSLGKQTPAPKLNNVLGNPI